MTRQFCVLVFLLCSTGFMRMEDRPPKYLYKILSYRNWQATEHQKTVSLPGDDAAFVHFSTEGQLDKIIAKHWSLVPQFVILKIDAEKIEGDLVYEVNPGGTTKYYHLYRGFIPFQAIVESKVVFREPLCDRAHALNIVDIGDPTLRKRARELTKEEILSPEIQQLIEEMKAQMRAAPGVGLAAPQIGKAIQLIVIEDMDHSHLTPEQIIERERTKVPFHVVINPKIHRYEGEIAEFFEGCLSVPNLLGIVARAKSVKVECLNEKAEPIVIEAKGWYARILQHEIDHVFGTLYIDRVLLSSLMTQENYIKHWKTRSIAETKSFLSL